MNQQKFENVVLYICENSPGRMTTTRLNKMLWLVDKTSFLQNASTITEWLYIRKRFGPVPKDNYDALTIMAEKGLLKINLEHNEGFETAFYTARQNPDMSLFSPIEIKSMEDAMHNYANLSTDKLIGISHDLVWATFEDGEAIPFEAYLSEFPTDLPQVRGRIELAEKEYQQNV